jgi:decaprenylphospho-beta-D-erythro-pentofuranosid-2-ulose 2-reductase
VSATNAGSAGRRVALLGGTSEIGLSIVAELQSQAPREVALLGRDETALQRAAEQLRARGVERVITARVDALDTGSHGAVLRESFSELGGADIVIVAVGVLGAGGAMPTDVEAALEEMRANMIGAGSLLLHAARLARERGGGQIVVLSSVAGERPRRANAVYGAAKAGLDALARGLGDELEDEGVRVLVVRPGFVRTRMTEGMAPAPLATDPAAVARAVREGLDGRAQVVWVPRPLRFVMLVMRLLPRQLFRRIRS